MDRSHIRNFSIIAHIDHGKSTLADRLLEITGTVDSRDMRQQYLDQMDLERERGITIKAQAVRLDHRAPSGQEYQLNLIDTPGHVDFSYEVSRSLAACEGALVLVDATQGIQAQTLANVHLAMELDLALIPIVNKIDLPGAEPEAVARQMEQVFGFGSDEIIFASAKNGTGVPRVLEAIIERIPPPSGDPSKPLRAYIFDSKYDSYKGVLAYVRVYDGVVSADQSLRIMASGTVVESLEVGIFKPQLKPLKQLSCGEVGYIATGLKTVRDCPVGDTITPATGEPGEPLRGYRPIKPMVFAGMYPAEGEQYVELREALEKLRLNDAALVFEPESSVALGPGFRCGFLGLLHMDIVQERLEREEGLNILVTAPSVAYQVLTTSGEILEVDNPSKLPPPQEISEIGEPWLDLSVIAPARYTGAILDLITSRRGSLKRMEYLQQEGAGGAQGDATPTMETRVLLECQSPLSEVLVDFYDILKSRTQGYASMDYKLAEYRPGDLVRLDILVNNHPVDALSVIIHRDKAQQQGRALVERLRTLIPRQLFEVPIQAAVGNRVIARETIKALRKNVLAKCYGGDVTRKRKLLEKQAEGKKRMKRVGNVEIPQEAFLSILKMQR